MQITINQEAEAEFLDNLILDLNKGNSEKSSSIILISPLCKQKNDLETK